MHTITAADLHEASNRVPTGDHISAAEEALGMEPGTFRAFFAESEFTMESGEPFPIDEPSMAYGIVVGLVCSGRDRR